ncbi:MAG: SBBP repeat-containing protein [Chloroflexota bacterium]
MKRHLLILPVLVATLVGTAVLSRNLGRPSAVEAVTTIRDGSGDLGRPAAVETIALNPSLFIENVGQFDPAARFQAPLRQGAIWLAEDGLWLTVMEQGSGGAGEQGSSISPLHPRASAPLPGRGGNLKLTFVGANPRPRLEPFGRLATHVSYFKGDDPAGWRPDVPVWSGVRYVDLYPGLDLEITSDNGRLTWRWLGEANSQFPPQGGYLQVDGPNDLGITLSSPIRDIRSPIFDGQGTGNATVAKIQNESDLLFSAYLGGSQFEVGYDVAVDQGGYSFVTGITYSADFPTTPGAFDPTFEGDTEVYVVKVSADGSELVYATYLGGQAADSGWGIAIDSEGYAYVTGGTGSDDFPTTPGACDTTYNGGLNDVFVAKLNMAGTELAYSTYLGGSGSDSGRGVAVNEMGQTFITGLVTSTDFPTTPGAFDTTYNGGDYDAFVARLNAAGSNLLYSTYLGGNGADYGHVIGIDSQGNATVTGDVESTDFPVTAGAFDTTYNGGTADAYVTKVSPAGSALVYSAYLGGSNYDRAFGLAVDQAGSAYVVGRTESADFPATVGAFDTTYNGDYDAYVAKVNPDGASLAYATFLGASGADAGQAIAVDATGRTYVTGRTASSDFPTTAGAYDTTHNGGFNDAFATSLDPAGGSLLYSTFLGGSGGDWGYGIAAHAPGLATITGLTDSADFPTTAGSFGTSYNGGSDNYVARLDMGAAGGCTEDCLRSTAIKLRGRHYYHLIGVQAAVLVTDENGHPVANAAVYVRWTVRGAAGDVTITQPADLTNHAGIAHFNIAAGLGTYTLTVETITKPGYTFDPDNSVMRGAITLPPDWE